MHPDYVRSLNNIEYWILNIGATYNINITYDKKGDSWRELYLVKLKKEKIIILRELIFTWYLFDINLYWIKLKRW